MTTINVPLYVGEEVDSTARAPRIREVTAYDLPAYRVQAGGPLVEVSTSMGHAWAVSQTGLSFQHFRRFERQGFEDLNAPPALLRFGAGNGYETAPGGWVRFEGGSSGTGVAGRGRLRDVLLAAGMDEADVQRIVYREPEGHYVHDPVGGWVKVAEVPAAPTMPKPIDPDSDLLVSSPVWSTAGRRYVGEPTVDQWMDYLNSGVPWLEEPDRRGVRIYRDPQAAAAHGFARHEGRTAPYWDGPGPTLIIEQAPIQLWVRGLPEPEEGRWLADEVREWLDHWQIKVAPKIVAEDEAAARAGLRGWRSRRNRASRPAVIVAGANDVMGLHGEPLPR